MNPQQIVIALFSALESQHFDRALSYLSQDFVFSTGDTIILDHQAWMAQQRALACAMPDLTNNYLPRGAGYGVVRGSIQLIGTHTGQLNLLASGYHAIAPTAARIILPRQKVDVAMYREQVQAIRLEYLPDGGIDGIITQIQEQVAEYNL